MSKIIAELFAKISPDPWREIGGFSSEMQEAHEQLKAAGGSEDQVVEVLSKWLRKYQPCLFGSIAAKLGMLSFCVLTEEDLTRDDEFIQDKIQLAREQWTREGFEGKKSGFILYVLSERLAVARPDGSLKDFAKELCSKYLLQSIDEDTIYTDEIWYEKPGPSRMTWKWFAGVNYFCANADNRWWQDHRIPGGLAFSVNSVGHMAKSCSVAKLMNELNDMLGVTGEKYIESKVDSLEQALEFAMRTIMSASDSVSGKATELLAISEEKAAAGCPVKLHKMLDGKDCRQYKGFYHTDITVPSEYFVDVVERPDDSEPHTLDFSYLYDRDIKNPDYITMGAGRRIRDTRIKTTHSSNPKSGKTFPLEEDINDSPRLRAALKK